MEDGLFPWFNFHGPISLKKNQQPTKPLDSLLGVNQMWTILLYSIVFVFSSFKEKEKEISLQIYFNNIPLP